LKYLAIFSLVLVFSVSAACDRELKEHPISIEHKREIAAGQEATDPSRSVSGTIRFDDALVSKKPENSTLFLIARSKGTTAVPPLAVKRYSLIKFPFEYKIGQENVMVKGAQFEGEIDITARLDMDGVAKAQPGDIEGVVTARAGDAAVEIVLDRMVETVVVSTESASVSGTIRVDPALVDKLPKTTTLFLIARSEGIRRGIPLAVKKVVAVEFPYSFALGQSDVMLPGAGFDGPITLFARVDQDGDAAPTPGDIDGKVSATAGDKNIELVLDNLIGVSQ
jgi:hypothetical protein